MDAHSMSIVTNSCVSLPRHPRTKLAATFDERTLQDEDYDESDEANWRWREETSNSGLNNGRSPTKPSVTASHSNARNDSIRGEGMGHNDSWGEREADLLASFESDDDCHSLSNEEFFSKLQDARKAHRENLILLEQAYNQKLKMTKSKTKTGSSPRNRVGPASEDNLNHSHNWRSDISPSVAHATDHDLYHINDKLREEKRSKPAWSAMEADIPKDSVRDMSTQKPPMGRPKRAWQRGTFSLTNSARNSSAFNNEWSDITWTSDSDIETSSHSTQQSRNLDQSPNSTLSLSKHPHSPAVIVDNMWDNFSVEGYAPRARTESRLSSRTNGSTRYVKSMRNEWSPKITVPKPFQMTKRDAQKEKKISRASAEIDEEIRRRKIEEEAECQKEFKAKPVPATTFIPLYEDLKERQTERSREIRLQSKQKLKEMQKPFNFEKREEKRKAEADKKVLTPPPKQSRTPKFKARRVPKAVFDPDIDQQILEEEEYRKIRIKMRAEEMLRSSSLPPNMEVMSKHYTDGKQRRKNMKKKEKLAFLTDEHKFHPHIKGVIPNYEEQHRKFQEEVRMRKQEREPTVVEPFNLRTSRIPSKRDKILAELEAEEERRKEEMRGYHTLRSSTALSTSVDDVLPIKTTSSSVLRKSVTDRTLLERAEQERLQEERERQKQQKQRLLRQAVAKKSRAHDASQSLEATSKEKLRQFRKAEKARQSEYERELEEMMARIESRPLLFERESQHNAQKRAERQYIDALRSAGLDEGFLERQIRSPGGVPAKRTDEDNHTSESSDEDLAVLKQTSDGHQDTYEVDSRSSGTFSSEEGSET